MELPQLPKPNISSQQSSIIFSILDAVSQISSILRCSPVVQLQTINKFGDQQLHLDVYCDEIVEKYLRKNRNIRGFASEERSEFNQIMHKQILKNDQKQYIVTYDPLDGSSIIDTNFTVGSIFSIWLYSEDKLMGESLKNQQNAVLALYGPRTTVLFYNKCQKKVQQLTLIDNQWLLSHEHLVIKSKTNMFSPGNLRAVKSNEVYGKVVQNWIDKQYTLRYTGGLVPDVQQIFIKGHGIFTNISSAKHKPKLRVLYEVAAVGFLMEKAEGATLTQGKISLLDYVIKNYDDKMYFFRQNRSFAAGSRDEVETLKDLF